METVSQANQKQKILPKEAVDPPQFAHQLKILEEERARKLANVPVQTFLELLPDPNNKKGGKVRLCTKMKNGSLHRQYLGRHKQVQDLIAEYQAKGVSLVKGG